MSNNQFPTEPPQQELVVHDEIAFSDGFNQSSDSQHDDSDPGAHGQHGHSSLSYSRRVASKTVVSFGPEDPDHPHNWSKVQTAINQPSSVKHDPMLYGSSIAGGATDEIAKEFHVTNQAILVLIISIFLIGYVLGPLLWGPLSEAYGRRLPLLFAFVVYTIFMMACGLAKSFPSLLVFRFIAGMVASAPIAVAGGIYADICADPTVRGYLMSYFMTATTIGPVLGPVASGFLSSYSWRWCFWFGLVLAGATLPLVIFMPETYAPIILQQRAKRLQKEFGNPSIVSPLDLNGLDIRQTLAVNLARPFNMLFHEPITSCSCLYLALTYAIFYLYFQAYPFIFQGIYGMTPAYTGLCYIPIGVGAVVACVIFMWYDRFLSRAKARNAEWANAEEYRRLPLACLGGILYVISLFWIGWTSFPSIHWIFPALSGIPFGAGYLLNFMAISNYLADAYLTYSASAMSASVCTRSILGAVLPLATKPMFNRLGVNWGCTIIAFLSLGVGTIPFIFIRSRNRIRENSKFCQELKRNEEVTVIQPSPKDLEEQGGRQQ